MFQVVQYPELPGLYILKLPQIQDFRQVLLEMDDYVIVMDAPPEQAPAVVDWARKNLGKPIGQVWPTHHHHDHAFGVKTYSQAGATVVVPEMAKEYYSNIPGIKFETYIAKKPYVAETTNFRATSIHLECSVHAADFTISVIMPPCPTTNSTVVIFDSDHVIQSERMPIHDDHTVIEEFIAAVSQYCLASQSV
ncbi:hypothetical protein IAQ61_004848 [Plenodomus lingam]|uniref:uncharacterized protein n=1 Tax=Leptosphaeria maculans TaxID=5022 RepID=UPI003317C641|nr:hypothetical protein IAQ61_004848 [Plenodomus lingam]